MTTRRTLIASSTAALAAAIVTGVHPVQAAAVPTLVELFTSQGCSSCPPADRVLAHLAARPDIVALAYHVDYWDYIGWKDPFASAAFTQRQRDYARAFGNRSVYTPQMVFAGQVELPGQSDRDAARALQRVGAANDRIALRPVRIDATTVEIAVQTPPGLQADLWAAAMAPTVTTDVRRGENAGRTLTNVNIVRALANLGPVDPGIAVTRWQIPAASFAPATLNVAVWIQARGLGPVHAAARLDAAADS